MQSEVGGHSLAGLPGLSQASLWPSARPVGKPVSTLSPSGEEEGTCCGGMNVPGEPSFSTLVPGEGGAFENIPALPDFVCVCVCVCVL